MWGWSREKGEKGKGWNREKGEQGKGGAGERDEQRLKKPSTYPDH